LQTMPNDLVSQIKALAAETGYAECGVTTADPFEDYATTLEELARRFPEQREQWLRMMHRARPREKAPWVRSIIVCIRWYGRYEVPESAVGSIGRSYLTDRRFEGCPDHDMPARMKAGLIRLGLRVKRGGLPDREAAARAGVARIGRNCFAYSDQYGSWINIETWLVDAELLPDTPSSGSPCPEGCDACIRACPTQALSAPFTVRMDQCIAYLTYEAPEPVSPELSGKMGKWIYGCDVCQEVCPLNKGKWKNEKKADWMLEIEPHLIPLALSQMNEETYRKIIHPRFWYIAEDNIKRWRASAARVTATLAAGNSGT